MEGMDLKFIPVIMRRLLGSLSMLGPMVALLGLIASPNSPNGGFTRLRLPSPTTTHPIPFRSPTPYITVVVEKVAQNPAVLAS